MAEHPRIGFIGIGVMGAAMVQRLLERGWRVAVWNREPERYPVVERYGALPMISPAAVAEASDVLLVCVLDGPAVNDCCFGPGGVVEAGRGVKTLIDLSTINPETTRDIAARLRDRIGVEWLDAPVSGGPEAARGGTLTVMVGGEAAVLDHCRPILDDLAANVSHMGRLGAGQATKILNQAIVGVSYVLMAEVLALARATDIAPELLPACLAGGLADSATLQRIYPQMIAEDFEPPKAYARQLDKDLRNVAVFAEAHGLDLPVLRTAIERYAAYVKEGHDMADSASVSRLYSRKG